MMSCCTTHFFVLFSTENWISFKYQQDDISCSCSFAFFWSVVFSQIVLVTLFFRALYVFFRVVISLLVSASVCLVLSVTRVSAVVLVDVSPNSASPLSPILCF